MKRAVSMAARALFLAGVVLAVIMVRAVTSSRAELARGDQLRSRGDLDAATLAYRRAAGWYAPGNTFSLSALERLRAVGEQARRAGDVERALAAYRAIRGAVMATRSFYTPNASFAEHAEVAIVELSASQFAATERADVARELAAGFARGERPSFTWTVLLLLGWVLWTGGAFAFLYVGLDDEDRLRARPAQLCGTAVIVGFGVFVIGMAMA